MQRLSDLALRKIAVFVVAGIGSAMVPVFGIDEVCPLLRWPAQVPTLTVSGSAELQKNADQMVLSIGVISEHTEAAVALAANSRDMQQVIAAVVDAGLDADDYETGQFQLTPRYSTRPSRADAPHWTPQIIGYRVVNNITVRTTKLELAGKIIANANKAGANTIGNIEFTLADPRQHRREAVAVAAQHAQDDAQALAAALGIELKRIIRVNLDGEPPIQPLMHSRAMPMMAAAESAPPIKPGDVTVRASVNLIWEIGAAE